MKVKLVFSDWQDFEFNSIYNTTRGFDLTTGDFHSGSTFDTTITLDEEQHKELKSALEKGFIPFFYVRLP